MRTWMWSFEMVTLSQKYPAETLVQGMQSKASWLRLAPGCFTSFQSMACSQDELYGCPRNLLSPSPRSYYHLLPPRSCRTLVFPVHFTVRCFWAQPPSGFDKSQAGCHSTLELGTQNKFRGVTGGSRRVGSKLWSKVSSYTTVGWWIFRLQSYSIENRWRGFQAPTTPTLRENKAVGSSDLTTSHSLTARCPDIYKGLLRASHFYHQCPAHQQAISCLLMYTAHLQSELGVPTTLTPLPRKVLVLPR